MKLDKIIKNTLIAIPFAAMPMMAQSNINGNVESVPSKTPVFARLTFMNLADTTQKNIAFTDSLTGLYSLQNVPNGPTEDKTEVLNHWLFKDTINVNGNQQMDFQIIKDLGSTSTVHPNILNAFKTLTATLDLFYPDNKTRRWNDYALPTKFFANNDSIPSGMRQYLDSAVNDILVKSDGKAQFNEVFTEPDTGVVFRYRDAAHMPCPGLSGCIYYDGWFPDGSPKHMTIFINTQAPPTQLNGVFRRELMRALMTYDYSTDPLYIQSINSQATELHPDEGKILQILYTLKHNTNMLAHRETIVTWTVPVELATFNYELNNNIVELSWMTATELNNQGFQVERSDNGLWKALAFIEGHGTSPSINYYNYADTLKNPGSYKYRLNQIDFDGTSEYSKILNVDVENFIKAYDLMQNYPNPFNPETKIAFRLPETSKVKIAVYDILGNNIATLVDKQLPTGYYEEKFDGKGLSSGIYPYRMDAVPENGQPYTKTQKMLLVK